MNKRILFLQYTNPANYPPLQHSSRILANAGWDVLFLGTGAFRADSLSFPYHDRIKVRKLPFCPAGWKQKLHYCRFLLWVLVWTLRFRPSWIYVSDYLASPAALIASYLYSPGIIYHEHDTPMNPNGSERRVIMGFLLWCRRNLSKKAEYCIIPNARRLKQFKVAVGYEARTLCVWNCPSKDEVASARLTNSHDGIRVIYHGSIVPKRVPLTVLEALKLLPDRVILTIIGYETIGSIGYVQNLCKMSYDLGIKHRVEFKGAFPIRKQILDLCRISDVGLSLMPKNGANIIEQNMVGASNKPFDYLACGLAVLVSDLVEWREMYVYPGYGLACDPEDPRSIAEALNWFLEHPQEMRLMGENGRRRIVEEWNYENQFSPLFDFLEDVTK